MTESEIVFAVQESPEGGYEGRALGHSIYAQAETLDKLKIAPIGNGLRFRVANAENPKQRVIAARKNIGA